MSEQRDGSERRRPGRVGRRDGDSRNVTREELVELQGAVLSWTRRSLWLLRAGVLLLVAFAIVGYKLFDANGDRVTDIEALASSNAALSAANAQRIADNEATRREAIILSCEETNRRHSNSLDALDELAAQSIKADPSRAAEIRQGTEQFKLFVNALVPQRDCERRADRLTHLTQ